MSPLTEITARKEAMDIIQALLEVKYRNQAVELVFKAINRLPQIEEFLTVQQAKLYRKTLQETVDRLY